MTKKIHAALVVGAFLPTLVVAALYCCCIAGSFPNYAALAFTTTPSKPSSTTNYAKNLPKSPSSPSSPQFQFPTTATTTTTSSLKMAMEEYDDDDEENSYEDGDTIDYIDDDDDESDEDLGVIVLDLEVEEDIVVGDDIEIVETTATTETPTATETTTTTETTASKASETSWSELFSEAAGAAVLLGGKAAKAAAEKVGELKTDDLPSLPTDLAANVPKSLKDAASQASNLGEVAAKVVSTATEAASDAIGGITTAVPGSSTILKRSKDADVAIPYDSAARLAYEEWQVEFKNKIPRPFEEDEDDEDEEERPTYTSEERFQFFQERYVNATIQNVALKKQLREAPPPPPPPAPIEDGGNGTTAVDVADDSSSVLSFIVLDQYADLSSEEYAKVMKSLEPKSWSDILGEIATLAGTAAASTAEIISSTTTDKPTIKVASNAAKKKKKTSSSPPAPSFSIFSSNRNGPKGSTVATSSTLKKKKVTKIASPSVPTKPASSMFGGILSPKKTEDSKSSKTKKAAVKTPKKYSKASKKNEVSRSSLSLFAPKPKKVESKQPTAPAPTRSTFSIFGSPKPASKTATKKSATKVAAKKKTAAVAKSSTPTLSNWVQNDDGSLTGKVSNSKNYRNGTKITTSPVRKGVRKGSVVKTGSGSQYKLM
eukprot:CAMPEP_0113484592 /NCGR_PEP_ID=MMETSP0014_2-20120614/24041_1 /TAXON_ID=2857 /ORGANISM="Nitzschia sp." /LENGTH=656 /DNA_ID=CAMNT_0000378199 /DNA_START=480 /DNA_END=2450 /DNA_ORIENTATION=+ /assembly_acc=CAM_ASM_000159